MSSNTMEYGGLIGAGLGGLLATQKVAVRAQLLSIAIVATIIAVLATADC
jgi:hypothetical protein